MSEPRMTGLAAAQAAAAAPSRPPIAGRARPAVCIVRHAYYPDGHVRRDAETLAQTGYDVSVVALRRPGQAAHEQLNGVAVHRLPVTHRRGGLLRYVYEYAAFLILAFLTVALLHARKRFRVVEVDTMPDVLVFSALVPKLTGAKVILYIFDNMPELLMVTRGVGARHPLVVLLARLERICTGFADRVIVTQEMARRVVIGRGVAPEKVRVVLNCPDEAIFPVGMRRPDARGDGRLEIVTHGAILERYGIHVLIDALPAIARRVPGVRLQVFGEGEQRAALETRARERGVADLVAFRGLVPLDELIENLARADVSYAGMLCDLMLSNKLVEYVALRVPVAAARWPTYEHYFPDDCVTYFAPGDPDSVAAAVLAIHADPAAARARAARAAGYYVQYRWTVQRDVYLDVYAHLVEAPRAGIGRPVARPR